MYGWHGRLLRVDLTRQSVSIETIDPKLLKDYIGGRGLAIRYLYDEVDPQVNPLAPENKLHLHHLARSRQPPRQPATAIWSSPSHRSRGRWRIPTRAAIFRPG